MKQFVDLFLKLESTTSTNAKISYLAEYFDVAERTDSLWVISLFSKKRPKRTVKTSQLREWAAEQADIPLWLFEETYQVVGDLAETIANVIPESTTANKLIETKSLTQWINYNKAMSSMTDEEKKAAILNAWSSMGRHERFLFNKLITGGFRMGVAQKTIVKALSKHLSIEENIIAHNLMGNWTPDTITFDELLLQENKAAKASKPYPFYLAYALDTDVHKLGSPNDWFAEFKWDGIRGQLIKREGQIFLWSRGEELITQQFPELDSFLNVKDDFVIDGELLVYKDGIQTFNVLQKRLGKKSPSKKYVEERPVVVMAYDILELNGKDLRQQSQKERRSILENLYDKNKQLPQLLLSKLVAFSDWESLTKIRSEARNHLAEGIMLKNKLSSYKTGRKKGDWYKWKLDPFTLDVVMLYAQRGHGRRANLFTDFTFAVKDGDKLVPIAKAYSGLTDEEFKAVSRFVKANTIERFGPVSSVHPELVFEIAFEAVSESSRHKSGIAVRFPRISRWRTDKTVESINTLSDVRKLIQ